MEFRTRKRAEAFTAAPSSSSSFDPTVRSNKRVRLSSSSAVATTTGTRFSRASGLLMDSVTAESSSGSRGGSGEDNRTVSESLNLVSDKGKEKEEDLRISDRETDRDSGDNNESNSNHLEGRSGLNMETSGGDEDDHNDDRGDVGSLQQNLTSASSTLQGLLRKLGAGIDDFLPSSPMSSSSSSHQNGRLKRILSGLSADGEEGRQVEALIELCEILSIGTEESLSTFSVDLFVPVLVGMLNHESNPDIMILAARALTHLCDVMPSSCAAVVHYGAVSSFCAKLLTIEYIDLAEQSLLALKKISEEHPTPCLRAGALMAVLSYLDFFATGVQRVALSTAANMCRNLPSDAADYVMDAVPPLTNLLQYHDSKVLEHASVCLTRISEAFASSPDKLDELCSHGLVTQAASLISTSNSGGGQGSLSTPTYTGLIRLLSTCASGSPVGAKNLLMLGISGILKDILVGSDISANSAVPPTLSRPAEQIFEIVNLANELLPPLPQGTISLPASSNIFFKGSIVKESPTSSSEKEDNTDGNASEVSAREKLLHEKPDVLQQFGMDLLPVLIQIYGSSVNTPIRHKCLSVIGKLIYFSSAEMIENLLSVTNLSSFLAGILASKDPHVLVPSLKIAEILLEKLPATFSKMFVREGVVHAVDQLVLIGNQNNTPSLASYVEKDNDSVSGMSSRSRRYRRRSYNSNPEGSSVEKSKNPASLNIGSPPSSVETPTTNLRTVVSGCAKAFKDKYFPSEPGAVEVGMTEELLHLKNLCMKLNAGVDDQKTKAKGKSKDSGSQLADISAAKEEYLIGVISEILAELSKGDGVSTFEFIGSAVVAALLNYFSCGYFSKGIISDGNLPKLRHQALKRFKLFISVALPSSVDERSIAPMVVLVQKLQNALSSVERFPVVLSHASRSSGGSAHLSFGFSALSQPFKLRLCRAHGEKSLRDYSSSIVLIDPLASLATVEDFLWQRVQQSDTAQKLSISVGNSESGNTSSGAATSSPSTTTPASDTRRHFSRSRSSVSIGDAATKEPSSQENSTRSSKGKGKVVLEMAQERLRGPQTRNAACTRAALGKDDPMKPVNGVSTSEDEELDTFPVEVDDVWGVEDDDISDDEEDSHEDVLRDDSFPVCMPDKVHDVKLGDSAEDGKPASAISDNQINTGSGSSSSAAAVKCSDSADFRSAYGSKGAKSFAAAAMAGLGSVNCRGIRAGRDLEGQHPFGSSNEPPKLIFTAGGKQLKRHFTIYQAIQGQLVLDEDEDDERCAVSDISSEGSRLWSDIYTITYQRADGQADRSSFGGSGSTTESKSTKSGSSSSNSVPQTHRMSLLDSILQGELPCDLERSNPTYNILALLRVLEGLNQLAHRLRFQIFSDNFAEGKISNLDELILTGSRVPSEEFINGKLTPKLARQMQDALVLCSGNLPSWCYQLTKSCPFLFPFETRRQYFYSTAFGLSRALYRLQQQQSADGHGSTNEREVRVGRLQRQKVRISRDRILDSAAKVMKMYSVQKAVLEVEYFGEVGTGSGPTLEFYTLLSHELQKFELGMWRSNSTWNKSLLEIDGDEKKEGKTAGSTTIDGVMIQAPLGLFPRPWQLNADASEGSEFSKVIEYFRLVGRVMAKALQDGRLLDLPLSTSFYKLVLGEELDLHDIPSFDSEFGKILLELHLLVCRKKYLELMGDDSGDAIADLRFRGAPIEDLCLDFTLPGHPDYILKPGDETVDINNLEEYISLVVDATVKTGIMRQMEAYRAGFNQVFDIASLQIFTPQELDYLLCGRRELWEAETLADHIKFDHGYTAKSPVIINLLEIMGEFTPDQQRAFCQFVTGAPRLPPGGLAVLNPKLTIVRKHSSPSESVDDDLPSVMTCANYLKLPPYSTKEILYKKLLYAISEGQGSFDLS